MKLEHNYWCLEFRYRDFPKKPRQGKSIVHNKNFCIYLDTQCLVEKFPGALPAASWLVKLTRICLAFSSSSKRIFSVIKTHFLRHQNAFSPSSKRIFFVIQTHFLLHQNCWSCQLVEEHISIWVA